MTEQLKRKPEREIIIGKMVTLENLDETKGL
jgi:hypothetical protein